jgi:hypothetical protein
MKSLIRALLRQTTLLRRVLLGFILFTTFSASAAETILITLTNSWRYNQTSSYDGTNWTAPTFDDSALAVGRGVLAEECGAILSKFFAAKR